MLVLYRTKDCPLCDELEEQLRDLALAHRIVTLDKDGSGPQNGVGEMPALEEGGTLYHGAQALTYMNDLRREVVLGRQFQSDACYLDPERPGECL